jgi:hypothetical protein
MWRRIRYVLVLISLCSIATCPAAHRSCRAKLRAREAPQLLDTLAAELTRLVAAGAPLPTTAAGPTPDAGACCEQGGQCAPDPARWAAEPWRTLRFSMDRPHRYSVEYAPVPGGALVRVSGDVDCDGVIGSVQLRATVSGKTVTFQRSESQPLE